MDSIEETIVFDSYKLIKENSKVLCDLVNLVGNEEEKKAYKSGVYAPCIKLQMALGGESLERGEKRHAEIRDMIKEGGDNVREIIQKEGREGREGRE